MNENRPARAAAAAPAENSEAPTGQPRVRFVRMERDAPRSAVPAVQTKPVESPAPADTGAEASQAVGQAASGPEAPPADASARPGQLEEAGSDRARPAPRTKDDQRPEKAAPGKPKQGKGAQEKGGPGAGDAAPATVERRGTKQAEPDTTAPGGEQVRPHQADKGPDGPGTGKAGRAKGGHRDNKPAQGDAQGRKRQAPDGGDTPERKARADGPPAGKPQGKPKPKAAAKPEKANPILFKPMAGSARFRTRHALVIFSFLAMVVLPAALSAWYLWNRAADQYASHVGFSVRTEEAGASIELLGAISGLSGSSSSDTDILYEFLQSQELVRRIDTDLDLREMWARADPQVDPVFAYHAPGTIEDLVDYWPRMVRISYDSGSGLLDLRVLAFDPEDARAIARRIFEESSAMINQLSAIAREDAIRYARDELQAAEERLTEARLALTEFRNRTQIVDPTMDTQGQMGLVTNLQAQLAEALIELDILRETTRDNDPRITQAERRIAVIENRIAAERANIGMTGGDGRAFADIVGEYERLVVDQEFAEQAYTAALASFDAARNEARRQSRYLAAHVTPTLAEAPGYPQRGTLLGLIGLFAFLIWSVTVLVAYSLRDRR